MISGIVLVFIVGWVVATDAHLLSSDENAVLLGLIRMALVFKLRLQHLGERERHVLD